MKYEIEYSTSGDDWQRFKIVDDLDLSVTGEINSAIVDLVNAHSDHLDRLTVRFVRVMTA